MFGVARLPKAIILLDDADDQWINDLMIRGQDGKLLSGHGTYAEYCNNTDRGFQWFDDTSQWPDTFECHRIINMALRKLVSSLTATRVS